MPNSRMPSKGEDLRAVLERELEERRGRAPEPGEIFVLSETAELPVEWALLEARPKSFLAIPADTQPLAGSRDFALGANVLSGPLVLRCGHAAEIAASRLRPELRTGLLDPRSLTAAKSLQAALANGTAAEDPVGEEVDRDPEYRDWVVEVLDPARSVLTELSEKDDSKQFADVIPFKDKRSLRTERSRGQISNWRRALPWLAAAGLAIALGWSRSEYRALVHEVSAPQFDEPNPVLLQGTVRGPVEFTLAPATGSLIERVHFSVLVPDTLPESSRVAVVLFDKQEKELVRSPLGTRVPGTAWTMSIPRSLVSGGPYRIELQSADKTPIESWNINVSEASPVP